MPDADQPTPGAEIERAIMASWNCVLLGKPAEAVRELQRAAELLREEEAE